MPIRGDDDVTLTLAVIASRLGISESTVSRTFSDPGKVAARTRELVLKTAGELGYEHPTTSRPRVLSSGIGVVVPDIANPFFPPILKAIQTRAGTYGVPVLITDSEERPREEAVRAEFLRDKVDGLVLVSPRSSEEDLAAIAEHSPLVLINREVPFASSVTVDSQEGIATAAEHLWALGHRHIAYLNGPYESWSNDRRRGAIQATATALGLELVEFGPFGPSMASGVHAADLVSATGATAVIAYDDLIALGVMARLQSRGVRVGTDISVVGIDDSPMSATAYPSLTTIQLPGARAGELAVDELATRMARPGAEITRTRLHAHLVVRESTGLAPGGGSSRDR